MSLLFLQTCEYLLLFWHLFWVHCSDISSQLGGEGAACAAPWRRSSALTSSQAQATLPACLAHSHQPSGLFFFRILYPSVAVFSLLKSLWFYWLCSNHPPDIFSIFFLNYFFIYLFEGRENLVIVMMLSFPLCKVFLRFEYFFSDCTLVYVLEKNLNF